MHFTASDSIPDAIIFTAQCTLVQCTLVQIMVLRSHVVRLSVCPFGYPLLSQEWVDTDFKFGRYIYRVNPNKVR